MYNWEIVINFSIQLFKNQLCQNKRVIPAVLMYFNKRKFEKTGTLLFKLSFVVF